MSTNFPTSLDSFPTPGANLSTNPHSSLHQNVDDAVTALETKVGVDNSAVTTTIDYLLKNTASTDPGHKHTPSVSLSATGTPSASTILFGDNTWKTSGFKFGGTGADGALNIGTGTTNINCANASVVVKNYTSISITGNGKLTFTNPATTGTIVILKSQGNVIITSSTVPAIDLSGMGGAKGTANSGNGQPNGGGGGGASINANGANSAGGSSGTAGSAGSGIFSTGVTNGSTGASAYNTTYNLANGMKQKMFFLIPGSGGNGGSGNTLNPSFGGDGGNGGGALYIECGGNYTCSSTITTAGNNGSNGTGGPNGGGGGGGGGGMIVILYYALVSNTGTYTVSGGSGGTSGTNAGGNGGNGTSLVTQNTEFS